MPERPEELCALPAGMRKRATARAVENEALRARLSSRGGQLRSSSRRADCPGLCTDVSLHGVNRSGNLSGNMRKLFCRVMTSVQRVEGELFRI